MVPMMITNMPAGYIAIRLGAKGPNMAVVTACASSTHSMGEAYNCIMRGDADVMITGRSRSRNIAARNGRLQLVEGSFGTQRRPETRFAPLRR